MLKRILIAGWTVVFSGVLVLGFFPKLFVWFPPSGFIMIFMIIFILVSVGYVIGWMFREGMKNASRK